MVRSQPHRAIEYCTKAMETQSQYRNLHRISFWETAVANFALFDSRINTSSQVPVSGLQLLYRAGGWSADSQDPSIGIGMSSQCADPFYC
jgi:hypothetical protein